MFQIIVARWLNLNKTNLFIVLEFFIVTAYITKIQGLLLLLLLLLLLFSLD